MNVLNKQPTISNFQFEQLRVKARKPKENAGKIRQ